MTASPCIEAGTCDHNIFLDGIACPEGRNPITFSLAKESIRRIWSKNVSASMLDIQGLEDDMSYIVSERKRLRPTAEEIIHERLYGKD
jgi:hypothetical protein